MGHRSAQGSGARLIMRAFGAVCRLSAQFVFGTRMLHRCAGVRQSGAAERDPNGRHGLGRASGAADRDGRYAQSEYSDVAGEVGVPENTSASSAGRISATVVENYSRQPFASNKAHQRLLRATEPVWAKNCNGVLRLLLLQPNFKMPRARLA